MTALQDYVRDEDSGGINNNNITELRRYQAQRKKLACNRSRLETIKINQKDIISSMEELDLKLTSMVESCQNDINNLKCEVTKLICNPRAVIVRES